MQPKRMIIVVLLLATALAGPLQAQDRWAEADRAVRRLSPDSFPGIPDRVRQEMHALGCTIPQGSDLDRPHNVVAGRFAAWYQVDWAFLCSKEGRSEIHVLWGGSVRCESPLGGAEDRSYLQGLGGDSIGFSRRLGAVGRERMLRYARYFDGPEVPDVWYQGIEDYFEGKASLVVLCVAGRWLKLQGID